MAARKILIIVAGFLLMYVGWSVIQSVRGAGIGGAFNSVGEWIGVGIIVYGIALVIGYGFSLITGRSVPFLRVPFLSRLEDPMSPVNNTRISREDRLNALEELRKQKLLTDAQYEKKREQILNQQW
jgi:hypothetical protein